MATYTGRRESGIELEYTDALSSTTLELDQIVGTPLAGIQEEIDAVALTAIHIGSRLADSFTDQILLDNKIYCYPTELIYSIITEDIVEEIELFNADLIPHYLVSMSISGGDGISIDLETPPTLFTAETAVQFNITIHKTGPALQNTMIDLLFDNGELLRILINGIRITAFPFIPTFSGLAIDYSYKSIVSTNEHYNEQRRPLVSRLTREQSCQFIYDKYQAQYYLAFLRNFYNYILGFAVYSEPITQVLAEIHGLATISVNETLTYYFNLAQSQYMIIIDEVNSHAEIKEIIGYSASSITFKYAVEGTFDKNTTYIYPCMIGRLTERDVTSITDKVVTSQLKISEIMY